MWAQGNAPTGRCAVGAVAAAVAAVNRDGATPGSWARPNTPRSPGTSGDYEAPLVGYPPAHFASLWGFVVGAVKRRDRVVADETLGRMADEARRSGWPNLFATGRTLAWMADQATAASSPQWAVLLSDYATELAPDLPEAHFGRARTRWASERDIMGALQAGLTGMGLLMRDGPWRRARMGNLLLALIIALLITASVFALAGLYRHGRALAHDVWHLLPSSSGRVPVALVTATFVVLPILFRVGWAWTLLIWVTLLGRYSVGSERKGAVMVLGFLAALPILIPGAMSHLDFAGSRAEGLYLASRDMEATEAAAALERLRAPSADELFVLGMRQRWSGDLYDARTSLEAAANAGGQRAALHTALGNLYFSGGHRARAISAYERANKIDPEDVPTLFNLSRAYFAVTQDQRATEARARATTLDHDRVEEYTRAAKRLGPLYVAPVRLPADLWQGPAESREPLKLAALQAWRWVGGDLESGVFLGGAVLAICAFFMLVWTRRSRRGPARCERCGKATCGVCDPGLPQRRRCAQCFTAAASKKGDPAPHLRIRTEREARRFASRARWVRRGASVLAGGGGQLVAGDSLKGVALMTSFFTVALGWSMAVDLIPQPLPAYSDFGFISACVWGGLTVLIYGYSVWDSQREDV